MPTPSRVLETLTAIANETTWLAMLWHVALVVALVAFLGGWRPTQRTAGYLLALPIGSVGLVAFAYDNPFNGLVFVGLSLALVLMASRFPTDAVARGADWAIVLGHALIAFGVVYPHFLHHTPLAYLIAAPFGTIPCPTLAVVAGFTLIAGGFSKSWNLTLVFFSVFYGTVGVMQLGVWIDIVLVAGALVLSWLAATLMYRPRYA